MDFHFHEPVNFDKANPYPDDTVTGLDLKRCRLKLNEKCFHSSEFQMRKV